MKQRKRGRPSLKQKQQEARDEKIKMWFAMSGIIFIVFSILYSSVVSADEMVHKFKSPSFSGIGTSAHYLTIENQEFNRKEAIKAEIKAYMDDCSVDYSSSDTKAELLEKLMLQPHSVPQVEEEYKYTEQEIDKTTLQNPSWKESAFKLGKLGSPRWNNDNSKVIVKYELPIQDGTFAELNGISGITLLSKSEALEEMKKDEWSG